MFYDVIVIGAGLAGLMAAEAAQEKGARVLILARGMGSLPLTTGCIDGLGYFPSSSPVPVSSPLTALGRFRDFHPQHPYSKLGQARILFALNRFPDLARSAEIPYAGEFDSNFMIPTALGTFHPTCLVPETMKNGLLSLPGRVLLLGFEGLKDFSSCLAEQNLNLLQAQGRIAPSFRAENLAFPGWGEKPVNGLYLARAFDEQEFRDRFVRQVQPLLEGTEKLGLPAVVGLRFSYRAWTDLQKKLGTDIFEIPLPPPSIPGLRLYNLLRSHRLQLGDRKGKKILEKNLRKGQVEE